MTLVTALVTGLSPAPTVAPTVASGEVVALAGVGIGVGLSTGAIKLPAGDMVIYPGTSVHRVDPVTRGARMASFFWVESMVRSDEHRRLLFDLDMNLLALRRQHGETPETTALTGTYHNLLRLWADT